MLRIVWVVMGLISFVPSFVPVLAEEKAQTPEASAKDPKAVEILTKADAAAKALKAARYRATFKPTGWLAGRLPEVEGSVVLAGDMRGRQPDRFRVSAKLKKAGSSESRQVVAGSDGEITYQIDEAEKKVYADMDPDVLGADGRAAMRLAMLEYVHGSPFGDELAGEKAELRGTERINNVECHKVYVKYAQNQGEAVWYFSTKDFLPLGVDRMAADPTGEGKTATMELRVLELETDPKDLGDVFKLVVPEGYTKVDDFAPRQSGL